MLHCNINVSAYAALQQYVFACASMLQVRMDQRKSCAEAEPGERRA